MRILITGGAGFIGCNLALACMRAGHQVTVFDNLSRRGSRDNLKWLATHGDLNFYRGDVRHAYNARIATREQDVIYHLAAQTAVTRSIADPLLDFETNALGTMNVLEGARQARDAGSADPIVIFSSTNKVYGALQDVAAIEGMARYVSSREAFHGISEAQPLDFHSPYGCSKGAADQYVRDYARMYGLRTVVFRQSCIYGQRQMGMEDQGWVAWFIIAALTGQPITVYGDGKQVRDLLHVDDLVRAFQMATERIEATAGQVYNIGGGPDNTLSIWHEFAPLLCLKLGRPVSPPAVGDWRAGDQKIYVSDIRKARKDFGWSPEISVSDGIGRLTDWVRSNLDLFKAG